MYQLHMMAHQRYEERTHAAEREARFLAECGLLATEELLVVAGESSHPLRRLFDVVRHLGHTPVLRRA